MTKLELYGMVFLDSGLDSMSAKEDRTHIREA